MRKFTITNADNTRMNIDLVRYFKFKNDCYLIYTLNEIDEKGYLKLYLVKVMEELGFPVMYNIKDDKEWAGMQSIVKKVIKEIKNNKRKFLEDLNYDSIQGIKIVEPRFFKLDQKLAEVLSSNYNINLNSDDNELDSFVESNNLELIRPTNVDSINAIDNLAIETNQLVTSSNVEEVSSDLESIDETLLKQGAFDPINSLSSENSNAERLLSSDMLNENNIVDESKIQNKEMSDNNIEASNESIINSTSEDVDDKNIFTNEIKNNNIVIEKETNNEFDSLVDYKALYLAEKEEKESINEAMNNLIEQLIKYKEKYGELE